MTLAIGIAANSAAYTMVRAMLWKIVPGEEPDRLMVLDEALLSLSDDPSADRILDWRDEVQSFSDVAAYGDHDGGLNLTGGAEPERVSGVEASASFFPVLGVNPALGRPFTFEEQKAGRNRVTVISNGLWQSFFGADPKILGHTISLNNVNFTVIGVMPRGFRFPGRADLWIPISLGKDRIFTGSAVFYRVFGRLKPEVTVDQARSDVELFRARFMRDRPDTWPATKPSKSFPY